MENVVNIDPNANIVKTLPFEEVHIGKLWYQDHAQTEIHFYTNSAHGYVIFVFYVFTTYITSYLLMYASIYV